MAFYKYTGEDYRDYPSLNMLARTNLVYDFGASAAPTDGRWTSDAGPATGTTRAGGAVAPPITVPVPHSSGLNASRPTPAVFGEGYWFNTDPSGAATGRLDYSDGTAWTNGVGGGGVGGGIPATIVDAAGDLIIATANDTVARLPKGSASQVLRVKPDGSTLEYADPSGSVTLNDRGAWASGLNLVAGDVVSYFATAYITKTAHTSGSSFDPTKFVRSGSLNRRGVYVPDGWGSYWKPARDAAGTIQVPVQVVGDSLTNGQSASTYGNSWVGRLETALQAAYGDGGSGFVNTLRPPARGGFTFGGSGSWVQPFNANAAQGPGGGQGAYNGSSGGTATVTVRGTIVEVFYLTSGNSGTGTATVSIDGGAAVAIATNRADGTAIAKCSKYRVTGLSSGNHTVVITTTNTGALTLLGAKGSKATGVVVDNHACPGHRSGSAALVGSPGDVLPALWSGGYNNPGYLGIWAYGVNDVAGALGAFTSPTNFILSLRQWAGAIMDATHGRADLIIVAPHVGLWSNEGSTTTTYAELCAAMRSVAEQYGAVFTNLWAIGENSWDWMNDQGYWSDGGQTSGATAGTDAVHLSNAGHQWWYDQLAPIVLDTSTPATVPTITPKVQAVLSQTATSGSNPKTVVFDASTSYAGFPRTIASYTFTPGDGSAAVTQAGPVFSYTYTTLGVWTPVLTVTDSAGATGTVNGNTVTISTPYALEDTFSGVDGTNLTAHTPNQGATAWTTVSLGGGSTWTFSLLGNQLAVQPGTGSGMLAVNDVGHHDSTITYVVGADAFDNFRVCYVDNSNYIEIAGGGANKIVAGTSTNIAFWGGSVAAGDTLQVIISGTGYTFKRNGSVAGTATVSDGVFTTASKVAAKAVFFGGAGPYRICDSLTAT